MKNKPKGNGMKVFGLKIRARRREGEFTQKEIAEMIGVSRYSVVLMEQGRFIPKGDKLIKLGKKLGIKLNELGL